MMKQVNILLLLLFFMACGTINMDAPLDKEFQGIPNEFEPYVQDFTELIDPYYNKNVLKSLSVGKKELRDGDAVGICKIYTLDGGPEIILDSLFWQNSSPERREALMFHELGHCLCALDHAHFEGKYSDKDHSSNHKQEDYAENGYLEDSCPVTVMHPTILNTECYVKHRLHYRNELRIRCYSRYVYVKKPSSK